MAEQEKHILTKKERALMHVILSMTESSDGVCLLRPLDILKALPYDLDYTPEELEPMLKGLELDDYFDFIVSDKKGEPVYVITMHRKGLAFARVERAWRKSLVNKVVITVAFAILSGTVAMLVRELMKRILGS